MKTERYEFAPYGDGMALLEPGVLRAYMETHQQETQPYLQWLQANPEAETELLREGRLALFPKAVTGICPVFMQTLDTETEKELPMPEGYRCLAQYTDYELAVTFGELCLASYAYMDQTDGLPEGISRFDKTSFFGDVIPIAVAHQLEPGMYGLCLALLEKTEKDEHELEYDLGYAYAFYFYRKAALDGGNVSSCRDEARDLTLTAANLKQ